MKKIFILAAMAIALAAYAPEAQAQGFLKGLADKAKEKLKEKVSNKVEDKVGNAADDVLNGNISSKKGSKKSKEVDDGEVENDEPAAQVSNQKSDFVPGSVVLFEDNFEGEKIGEFPSKWDQIEGNVEMAKIGGRTVPQWVSNGTIAPLMKKNQYNYLTEEFTIEWDVYISKKNYDWGDLNHELKLMTREEGVNSWNWYAAWVTIWWRPSDGASVVGWHVQKPNEGSIDNEVRDGKTNIKAGAWNHFAISFNKRAFKIYVNGVRICNVPNMLQPRYVEYASTNSEGYPYSCISNMRIAQGAVKLYDRNAQDLTAVEKAMAETGKFVTNNILFETGKADLKAESMEEIQKVADYMKKNSSARFLVVGHTDNVGNAASNQTLSENRAKAVVAALAKLGVDDFNLKAEGRGASEPVADNKTAEGKAKNRRVEFIKK